MRAMDESSLLIESTLRNKVMPSQTEVTLVRETWAVKSTLEDRHR